MIASILAVPPLLLWLAALAVALALACGGQAYLVRRGRAAPDLAGTPSPMIGMAGTLYAVLLGFMTVVSWQHFYDSREIVTQEAAADADAWHAALALPPDRRSRVRRDVARYATVMIDREWSAMRTGAFDNQADVIVMDAIDAATSFNPANAAQSNAQSATLRELSTLHDLRQRRLSYNAAGLPWFDWLVLIAGAACIVVMSWVFGVPDPRVHMLMTAIVAVLVASTLTLLFELQFPFRGGLGISAQDWAGVVDHIRFMQQNSSPNMRM
ncbi:MAG TPA: DUF4239 domain-containing protein [Candidatus Elarobacter sp.]